MMISRRTSFAALILLISLAPLLLATQCTMDSQCGSNKICSCGNCVVNAAWYTRQNNCLGGTWSTWGPVAIIGVIVMMLIVAIAYMLAIGFDLSELRMWAKSEFYQALASAVLVGGLVTLTTLMLDEGVAKILGQSINPFDLAHNFLSKLTAQLQGIYITNYKINFPLESLATFTVYNNATSTEIFMFMFLKPILIEPLHFTNHLIIQIMLFIYFWRALLNFFQFTAFNVFFPLGIFLRIFPVTRGAGAMLIAIALGLFLVFPIMFGFIAMMTEDQQQMAEILSRSDVKSIGVDLATFNACEHDVEEAAKQAETQTDPAVLSKINEFNSFMPPIIMKVLFYPFVVWAVTISFIRIMAPLLGADITELGQGLLKLI